VDAIDDLISDIVAWANGRNDIIGIMLVGSHARREAMPDSDIDLIILCDESQRFLEDTRWIERFTSVDRISTERWGAIETVRAYIDQIEVEFNFADLTWISSPIDEGTGRVLAGGRKVLLDKTEAGLENALST
jgi:predicted nucleotidyltransferase